MGNNEVFCFRNDKTRKILKDLTRFEHSLYIDYNIKGVTL